MPDLYDLLILGSGSTAFAAAIRAQGLGMRFHATIDDFIDTLHVYPTMAEALKMVAISRYKDPRMLSCCAE